MGFFKPPAIQVVVDLQLLPKYFLSISSESDMFFLKTLASTIIYFKVVISAFIISK